MTTLDDTLLAFRGTLPLTLIDADAWSRIVGVAARLPFLAMGAFGFECRLDERSTEVDFLICVETSKAALLNDVDAAHARLARGCTDAVSDMWLEYDLPGAAEPSVFYHFHQARAEDVKAVAAAIGQPLDAPTGAVLERCFAALPPAGLIDQAGFMLSRGQSLRLVVRLPWGRVGGWLSEVGWDGPADALAERVTALSARCDYGVVDVDLSPGVGRAIGLECHFDGRRQPVAEPRWAALLDLLGASAARRDALLEAPCRVRWTDPATAQGGDFILLVSHLKSGFPDPRAKAYLGFLRVS